MIRFGDFFAFMFATICNKLDIHEPLIQNIFVCITDIYEPLLTVYMNDFSCEVLAL